MYCTAYCTDRISRDYLHFKGIARKWARIAIANKRDGLPWQLAAAHAHDALSFALLIIR